VARRVVTTPPIRVEYTLTRKGRALGKAVRAITDWAHTWIDA
jgi:DNA-binding HxlR family transcriptional regulator